MKPIKNVSSGARCDIKKKKSLVSCDSINIIVLFFPAWLLLLLWTFYKKIQFPK